jgi:hypothetical protein
MHASLSIEVPLERLGVLVASASRLWSGLSLHVANPTLESRLSRRATPTTSLDCLNRTSPVVVLSNFCKMFRPFGLRFETRASVTPLWSRSTLYRVILSSCISLTLLYNLARPLQRFHSVRPDDHPRHERVSRVLWRGRASAWPPQAAS